MIGRRDEAARLFERLLALRNDVGLLREEYDPRARRLVGNFPQAFSHVALVNTAHNLAHDASRPSSVPSVPSPASRPCARPRLKSIDRHPGARGVRPTAANRAAI